jgi:hypothetical protein
MKLGVGILTIGLLAIPILMALTTTAASRRGLSCSQGLL